MKGKTGDQPVNDKTTRVVVLGGGFAGAFTARYLKRFGGDGIEVELVNNTNYFVFQPLLPEVASGTISAPDAVTPLRYMLPGVTVRMADVRAVDFEAREVQVVQGSKRVPITVCYDHLVICLGQKTDLSRFPGFEQHSLTMRDLADAHGLRNQVIQCLEHADVTEDMELKQRLLTFVVAGGGFSGVETMGELHEMIRRSLRFYPNVGQQDITPILIQRGARLLPELPQRLGEYTREKLERRGIRVLLGKSLRSACVSAVELDDGSMIPTGTLVTTVGNGPTELVRQLDVARERGKLAVSEYLQVRGHENVWALGDAALVPLPGTGDEPRFAPPTAQFAVREAKCAARNIVAASRGHDLQPFDYKPRGSLASIGNYRAVAEVFGMRLSGLFAWLLWRGFYISMLPGLSTKIRVALNWAFDYVLPRNIVQIKNAEAPAVRRMRYANGDVLFRPGQFVDGFYVVLSGTLESRVPDARIGEDFVRLIGAGDHWGERTLTEAWQTHGTLTAVDDCEVLVLQRQDFRSLREAMPEFDAYFRKIPDKIYPRVLRATPSADDCREEPK